MRKTNQTRKQKTKPSTKLSDNLKKIREKLKKSVKNVKNQKSKIKRKYVKKIKVNTNIEQLSEKFDKKPRKKRTKNVSKIYFTDETEQAIIKYNLEENEDKRNVIFNSEIKFPFEKLIENIFNKFKFSYFETSPQDVQLECLTHMVANMHKFDPTRCCNDDPKKKAKAYSYFSIVAKNFFILLNNGNYKRFNQNVEISDDRDENTIQLQQHDKYHSQVELSDFMRSIIAFWDMNIEKVFPKLYDLRIASAVVDLLRKSDYITMFNKKALYLYIRDIADCKTSHVTKIINKMKIYQSQFEEEYASEGHINYDLSIP